MALTKGSYYRDEGPEIPAAGGGDYGAPTPEAAVKGQHPYQAPTSVPASNSAPVPHSGFDALDTPPKVTNAGAGADGAKGISASTAFDPRPSQWDQ